MRLALGPSMTMTVKKVDWKVICALALVTSFVAGCSSPEKKYCERMLEKLKVDADKRDELRDECITSTKKDIERCENSDEVRECYGNITDGDSTPCVRVCNFTEAATKQAGKESRCSDIADRCMKVCGLDHDCRMDCVEAQNKCEGSDDD